MKGESRAYDASQELKRMADTFNSSSREHLEKAYKKTTVMGLFFFDAYPKDSRNQLVAGLQSMAAPSGKKGPDWTPESVPRLHEEGYLRAMSWSSIGILTGQGEDFPYSPKASNLPAEFSAVTVDVTQFADYSYLAMYGFILGENLEPDFLEKFVHSEDMITGADNMSELKGLRRRSTDRGRIKQIEKKARDWIAQYVSGTWITPKSDEECPTALVFDIEDPGYRPDKDWFWENYRILDQMGARSYEVSGDSRLAVAPSTIPLGREGGASRGLVLIHFNRLGKAGEQTTPFELVEELRSPLTELAVRMHSIQYRSSMLSLKLPNFNIRAESLQKELFSVAGSLDETNPRVQSVKALQGIVKRINTTTTEVTLAIQGLNRHSELFDSYPTHADRFNKLPFLQRIGDVTTFGEWIDGYARSLGRIALSESQVIADQLTTNRAFADNMFQSASTLANLRLQSSIRTFTFVVVLLTIVVPVSIALIEYFFPRH